MTRHRSHGTDFAFLGWLRARPDLDSRADRLSVTDFDVLLHQYRDKELPDTKQRDDLMVLEVKTFASGPAYSRDVFSAQADTWRAFNRVLCTLHRRRDRNGRWRHVPTVWHDKVSGATRRIYYHGVHAVALQGERPDQGMHPSRRVDRRNHHAGEVALQKPILLLSERGDAA